MATEKRLIDANAFRKSINGWKLGKIPKGELLWDLDRQPTVDAVEVVYGRWEDMYDGKYDNPRFRCSVCKEKSLFKDKRNELGNWEIAQALTPFCPHCGATLDGGSDDA